MESRVSHAAYSIRAASRALDEVAYADQALAPQLEENRVGQGPYRREEGRQQPLRMA